MHEQEWDLGRGETSPKEKIHIVVTVMGLFVFSNGEIAEGRHKVAVLIVHSNLANWLTNIKAKCKRRAWSAHLSQLHTVCPCQLSITLKCTEAEDWDVIEGDINGKLCLWHWWEACPLLACVSCAMLMPECTRLTKKMQNTGRIQKRQYHISINDGSDELHEENTMCTFLLCFFFFFFFSLHPLISSQGHRKLQTIPACTRRKAGKSLQAFRHTVQTLIHTSRQFRVSSPPDCGRKLAQLKQKQTFGPIVFNNNINHWVALCSIFKHQYIIDGLIW